MGGAILLPPTPAGLLGGEHEAAEFSTLDIISLRQKKKEKEKCHVVIVPLLGTEGSVQSKPFRVVQNVLKKQLFFGVHG